MFNLLHSRRAAIAMVAGVVASVAGFGTAAQAEETITLYSGRSKALVEPLIAQFTKDTGIKVSVKYGTNSAQIAQQLKEEGERSPADVIWVQDAGTLESLTKAKLFATLPDELYKNIGDNFKTADRSWIATSGRARVLAYSPLRVKKADLPQSVFDLTDPKWKGKIGWAPANASFQTFVTAMRAQHGDEKTTAWLKGILANEPKKFPSNVPIVEAIGAGEIDIGLPNHYYLLGMKKKNPDLPVAQTFFKDGDIGNLLFPAAAATLKSSKNEQNALKFIEYILNDRSQEFFTTEVNEFPVSKTVKPSNPLLDTKSLEQAHPKVNLENLQDIPGTLKLLRELNILG